VTSMIVRLRGPGTLTEVWTGPAGRGKAARYTDVIRYSAQASESVPIELDGPEHGRIAVVDLVAPKSPTQVHYRSQLRSAESTGRRSAWRAWLLTRRYANNAQVITAVCNSYNP
jgi:hypothetical protein